MATSGMVHNNIRNSQALKVRVQPRASKSQIVGFQEDGRLKIRIKAVPEDGKANLALIKFLARVVGVPAASIRIISGASSQNKLVLFEDLDLTTVMERIQSKIE